jgi:hypothetical protein
MGMMWAGFGPRVRNYVFSRHHRFVSGSRRNRREFHIHVIPILIGEGIPLIEPRHRCIRLELLSSKAHPDGVVHLNYRVTNCS